MRDRFLVFADLHLHNWREFSSRLPNGKNSRLQDGVNVLDQILDYALQKGISLVVFLGDLIHSRVRTEVEVYNAAWEALKRFQAAGVRILAVVGNHDQALKSDLSVHALRPLSEIMTVIDSPTSLKIGDALFLAYPYGYPLGTLRVAGSLRAAAKKVFLLGHFGVQGAVVGSGSYTPSEEIALGDVKKEGTDLALLGHYHKHQCLSKDCIYAGSPLQMTWMDTGDAPRGFLEVSYDEDGFSVDLIPVKAPRFVEVAVADLADQEIEGNFIKLRLQPGGKFSEVEGVLREAGVRAFYTVEDLLVEEKKRIDIGLDNSLEEMVDKYVDFQETALRLAKLKKIGLEIIKHDNV